MEVLLGFFALWALGWWVVAIIALAVVFGSIDDADDAVVTVALLVLIGVTILPYGTIASHWIAANWLTTIVGVVIYCAAGMAWALFKFDRRLAKIAGEYKGKDQDYARRIYAAPQANKGRIINWILHWPFSIIHDLTIDLGNTLYAAISGRLDAIVNRHFPEEK
jgi:hypothetical protein